MKATITMVARIKQKFVKVPLVKKQYQPIAGFAGSYYARLTRDGKQVAEPLGQDFTNQVLPKFFALKSLREYEDNKMEIPAHLVAKKEVKPATPPPASVPELIADYLDRIDRDPDKSLKTYNLYRGHLRHFENFCAKPPEKCPAFVFPALTFDVLTAFKHYLQGMKQYKRSTIFAIFRDTMIFLKWAGVQPRKMEPAFKLKHWPKNSDPNPEAYTDEEWALLQEAAKRDAKLWLNMFMCVGMRKEEMTFALYGDLDFKANTIHIKCKPQFNDWKPKFGKEREVPVPPWIMEQLKARMLKSNRQKKDLIFFNRDGGPQKGFLSKLKTISQNAGVSGKVTIHKFRATAITLWLEDGVDVVKIMRMVGHTNPSTILHYAAKQDIRKPEVHARATRAFARFAPGAVAAD